MGQKIITKPFDKSQQDSAKYKLYVLMLKLILPDIFEWEERNFLNQNYN